LIVNTLAGTLSFPQAVKPQNNPVQTGLKCNISKNPKQILVSRESCGGHMKQEKRNRKTALVVIGTLMPV
jgi:hypothetical protein